MDELWNAELEDVTARCLSHYLNGTTDMVPDTYTIEVDQYLDKQRFELEVEELFRRGPLLLALSVEIPTRGNFKKLEIANVPVLLTRTAAGEVKSFINVCRHRGSPVVTDDRGTVRRFVCPYHAWTYDLDGSLVHVTAPETFGPIDTAEHGLVELPVVERDGLVWGLLKPGLSLDLDQHLGELGPELAKMDLGNLSHGASRRATAGNWKLAMDTYLENYHLRFLHPTTLYPVAGTSNMAAVDLFGIHQRMSVPRKRIGELDGEELSGKDHLSYVSLNYTIMPNTVLLVNPEAVMIAQVFPGPTVGESFTIQEFYSRQPRVTEEDEKAFQTRVDTLSGAVQNEDYWMQDLVQRGLRSGANTHLTFGRNEPLLHHFHTVIDNALANADH